MCAFEMSSKSIKYDSVFLLKDGLNGRKQTTLSVGFTEDGGNLGKLLNVYSLLNGEYKEQFAPFLPKIGKGTLANSNTFITLLKEAAQNDPFFCECQEFAYRALYMMPAFRKCEQMGIKTALGVLVVVDSVLHGSLETVAAMFAYPRPSRGGDEKEYIAQYVNKRRSWWEKHDNNPNGTTYRMDCMIQNIKNDNWDLSKPFVANGVTI